VTRPESAKQKIPQQNKEAIILEAAEQVFAIQGYYGSTMRAIARQAGIATGTIYLYFPNKQSVFLALINNLHHDLIANIAQARMGAGNTLTKLKISIAVALRVFSRQQRLAKIVLIQAAGTNPTFDRRLAEIHAELVALVQRDLDELVAEGDLPVQDTMIAACAWVGTFYEVIINWLWQGQPFSLERAIPVLIRYNLRGLGVKEE
jgi:TetR/AcrR family fatty acid metabolism transcriptional regulator